jgi:hypothetical protein
MSFTDKNKTFLANGALVAYRRVKVSAGTVTSPPQVEYAGAGDYAVGVTLAAAASGESVPVKLLNDGGTFQVEANGAIVEGADLYGTANGRVDDAGTGTVQFVALEAASGAGAVIECSLHPYLATAAGSVSIVDAGGIITGATVEAALAEIMVGFKTAQYCINPDGPITLETGAPTLVFANGAADGFTQLTNKEVVLRWNNHATPTKMAARFIIPPDLDPAADIVVHFLGALVKAGGALVDSPTMTCEAYFAAAGAAMLADANCGGVSGEFLTAATDTYQEKTRAIALADIPAVASVLTLIFNPTDGELGTDDFVLAGVWLEVTRKCLTS